MRKPKQFIPAEIAGKVYRRDGSRCRYCGDTRGPFQLDHVYPESKGGETSVNNLVVSCSRCNNRKHAKVGVWPYPVGYFDDISLHNKTTSELRSAVDAMRERLDSVAPIWWYMVMLAGILLMSAGKMTNWLGDFGPLAGALGTLVMVGALFATMGWEAKT